MPFNPEAVKDLITPSEFARSKGVTPAAVHKALERRIAAAVVMQDGKRMVNADLAGPLWDRTAKCEREPKEYTPRPKGPTPKPKPVAPPSKPAEPQPKQLLSRTRRSESTQAQLARALMAIPDDKIPAIFESDLRKAHYSAELAKMKALREREELGSIAEMRSEAFTLAKATREAVLAVGPRISAELAATTDTFGVEQLMERELIAALRSLVATDG